VNATSRVSASFSVVRAFSPPPVDEMRKTCGAIVIDDFK
jgi:hypothetical protein